MDGGFALILGRFVPAVRTYVPLAAGTSAYHYRKFLLWNLTGAAAWTILVSGLARYRRSRRAAEISRRAS